MHEENDEFGENTVSDVFLKGYKMGDKIIRHATVKVAN
jgi:molecular chaperone GrpE